jgi:hypothetical protein
MCILYIKSNITHNHPHNINVKNNKLAYLQPSDDCGIPDFPSQPVGVQVDDPLTVSLQTVIVPVLCFVVEKVKPMPVPVELFCVPPGGISVMPILWLEVPQSSLEVL